MCKCKSVSTNECNVKVLEWTWKDGTMRGPVTSWNSVMSHSWINLCFYLQPLFQFLSDVGLEQLEDSAAFSLFHGLWYNLELEQTFIINRGWIQHTFHVAPPACQSFHTSCKIELSGDFVEWLLERLGLELTCHLNWTKRKKNVHSFLNPKDHVGVFVLFDQNSKT